MARLYTIIMQPPLPYPNNSKKKPRFSIKKNYEKILYY